ncbi:hypothetical protein PV08_01365 [Exophiala spinifera]|uniref:Uncharacterized protein n=1 Tax=Exophiala spinifera TaxID=91928 RepID=A0A0D2A7M1_9EURO|nr:uncharacterized protein PV08_01365 [Exophiala spinifera]KIW20787.1 hypothetical protein PV08_01365 [Exophiala spinifera]
MSTPTKTIALISGANTGIGEATARILAQDHGFHVLIGSRNLEAGQKVADSITSQGHSASAIQLDITSDASIAAAVRQIEQEHGGVLDVLINNAGILIDYLLHGRTEPSSSSDKDGKKEEDYPSTREIFTRTMLTNVVGTACLTDACVPLLRRSTHPRVIFVSSIMGSIKEATVKSNMWYPIDYKAYDTSKAGVNMLTVQYARILEDVGASVNAVCPGLVRSQLTRYSMGDPPEVGARRIVELAIAEKGGPTATFTNIHGPIAW